MRTTSTTVFIPTPADKGRGTLQIALVETFADQAAIAIEKPVRHAAHAT